MIGMTKGDGMEGSFARLEGFLSEEKALFESLLKCLNEQKQALVANDVERITRMVENTKEVVWRLRRVHSERERATAELSASATTELKAALENAPPQVRARMERTIDEMRVLIDSVRRVNSSNVILSASGLEYLSKCVEILLGQETDLVTYTSECGPAQGTPRAHLLDHSA